jgi:hypothetical protein
VPIIRVASEWYVAVEKIKSYLWGTGCTVSTGSAPDISIQSIDAVETSAEWMAIHIPCSGWVTGNQGDIDWIIVVAGTRQANTFGGSGGGCNNFPYRSMTCYRVHTNSPFHQMVSIVSSSSVTHFLSIVVFESFWCFKQ